MAYLFFCCLVAITTIRRCMGENFWHRQARSQRSLHRLVVQQAARFLASGYSLPPKLTARLLATASFLGNHNGSTVPLRVEDYLLQCESTSKMPNYNSRKSDGNHYSGNTHGSRANRSNKYNSNRWSTKGRGKGGRSIHAIANVDANGNSPPKGALRRQFIHCGRGNCEL